MREMSLDQRHRAPAGTPGRAAAIGGQAVPGKRTLTELLPGTAPARTSPLTATTAAASGPGKVGAPTAPAAAPSEGLGGGPAPSTPPDPGLHPDRDADRNTLTKEGTATTGRNPQIDGRPVDPDHADGWGAAYGDCHGVVAFKNVVPDPAERARIAGLHDGGLPGADQFSLTVPFRGALAYQCVEFVTRYYRDALGHSGLGGGHAQTFLQGPRGGLEVHRFPTTPTRPQAGDLFVQEGGVSPVGHVGIVESVSGNEGGAMSGTVIQQNWSTTTPATTFKLTPRPTREEVAPGVFRNVIVYACDHDWSGFRRKPGTAPVPERGGTTKSLWLGGSADHGEGNYFVADGSTVALSNIASIYGLSLEQLRTFNPAIGDAVSANGRRIEVLVTDSFVPAEPVIGTATITGQQATIRSLANSTSPSPKANSWLPHGRSVRVYQEIEGAAVPGFQTRQWYKIALYSGEDAYVFKGLCSDLA